MLDNHANCLASSAYAFKCADFQKDATPSEGRDGERAVTVEIKPSGSNTETEGRDGKTKG